MLYSKQAAVGMGAPSLPAFQPVSRHFPQWSRTAILTITSDAEGTDEVKKSPPESSAGPGFIIGGDAVARVAHLEHSVRFLQEQHRLMLSGLHAEIEALRERNRDLQFQLIFNKESTVKATPPATDDTVESNEESLRKEVDRLEKEAAAARGEARAAEARALQLQRLVDAQTEKLRELELRGSAEGGGGGEEGRQESRAELRLRLAEAERLVRRLRADAERQRREVLGGAGVTNLLFDGAAARHAHCMKNSLHASLRASGLDYGYQNHYHFPPVPTADFWREPLREEFSMGSRNRNNRRPLTLPELTAVGQPLRSTVYANNHTRARGYGYDKNKKSQSTNGETTSGKSPGDPSEEPRLKPLCLDNDRLSKPVSPGKSNESPFSTYPELKIVVTKIIPHGNVSSPGGDARARARRPQRKLSDHT